MANSKLQVRPRTVTGKKVARLRREGVTPANIFGHKIDSTSVEADTVELTHLLRGSTKNAIIDLSVAGEDAPRTVVVREVSRDPVNGKLLHIDFYQVSMSVRMKADVPVVLHGTSDAVATYGGVLLQMLETISVDALPGDIPAEFVVDVSKLTELDQSFHVRDLHIDETKVTVHTDPDVVVARVAAPRLAAETEETPEGEGAAAAAPAASGEAPAPAEQADS